MPLGWVEWTVLIAAAAISMLLSFSYLLHDTDLWQLLVAGKSMWTHGALPRTDEWTWVGYGDPQTTSSWGFRAILWPLWDRLGVAGLYLLRWGALLSSFAILVLAARRMGARGATPLVVAAWAALAYRLRAEVRPETFVAVLLAAEMWILETWRNGGPDRRLVIPALALVWVNVHVSWWLAFLLLAIYAIDAIARPSRGASDAPLPRARIALSFAPVVAAMAVALFLNPYGVRAIREPFEFILRWRHEPMFRNVTELHPVNWHAHRSDGLPVLAAVWPLLLLWRLRRHGIDVAGWLCMLAFGAIGLTSQRFLGFMTLVATPFVARDLSEFLGSLRWPRPIARSMVRAAVAAAVCLLIGVVEWRRTELPLGIGFHPGLAPVGAAEYLERAGVSGRMFNHFHFGGYLAYRSWPSRDRLPFVTTQPENIRPAIRAAYPRVFVDSTAWHALDREYGFDIAVLVRDQDPGDRLLDYLDADTSWALVFVDDAAEVLIRRRGPLRALAERDGYRLMPAGVRRRLQVVPEVGVNLGLREQVRIELDHMAASSKENGGALHMLGILDLMDGQYEVGGKRLKEALQRKPFLPRVHELLGVVALERGKPDEALREFGRERAMHGSNPQLEVRTGMAYEARHDLSAARRAYLRALELEPGRPDAMEAVQRLAGS